MPAISNNLKFLNDLIKQIEDYYNVELDEIDKDGIRAKIYNSIVVDTAYIPKYFKIKHKGQIVKGKLGNILPSDLMVIREQHEKTKFTEEDWENCLLPVSDSLVYCKASSTIYHNIDSEIKDWLIETEASDLMHRIVCSMKILPKLNGETIKIYDAFIRKEKSMNNKKLLLGDCKNTADLDDELWALRYLEVLYTSEESNTDVPFQTRNLLRHEAETFNIVYEDLRYRVEHGMAMLDAMELGRFERKHYDLSYCKSSDNSNFIKYLKYYIKNRNN